MKKYFLLAVVLFLGACAEKKVILDPVEFVPMEKLDTLTKAKPGSSVAMTGFKDARADQDQIGTGKGEVPIYLFGGVEKYTTQRFTEALKRRDIQVNDSAAFAITGTIKKLWVTEIAPGFSPQSSKCDLQLDISLVPKDPKQNTYFWNGMTSVQGTQNVFNTRNSDGAVLDACVNEAVEKFLHNEKVQKALGIDLLPTEPKTTSAR